jgi:hypothetical protein
VVEEGGGERRWELTAFVALSPLQASTRHGAVPFGIQRSAAEKEAAEEGSKRKADPAASMLHYLAKTRKHKEVRTPVSLYSILFPVTHTHVHTHTCDE